MGAALRPRGPCRLRGARHGPVRRHRRLRWDQGRRPTHHQRRGVDRGLRPAGPSQPPRARHHGQRVAPRRPRHRPGPGGHPARRPGGGAAQRVRRVGARLLGAGADLAPLLPRPARTLHRDQRRRGHLGVPGLRGRRRRGGAADGPAPGHAQQRRPQGHAGRRRAPRHRRPGARREDADPLPAQRAPQRRHPEVRRRGDRPAAPRCAPSTSSSTGSSSSTGGSR